MKWQWSSFEALSCGELYAILKLRQAVFIVEQNCPYLDADGLDQVSWHLMGWREDAAGKALVAYSRLVFPGNRFPEPSIGRVITALSVRGTGVGKALTRKAVARAASEYPHMAIRISAQQYLEKFYARFGFETVSEPYDEDGIPHVEMLRTAP